MLSLLYISNKTECFRYKGGCGVHGHHMCIKAFKRRAWATGEQLWTIRNIILFKTVTYTTNKLKNKAILSLKQYRMHCYVVLSNVVMLWDSDYSKQDSRYMCLCLLLLNTVLPYHCTINNDYT